MARSKKSSGSRKKKSPGKRSTTKTKQKRKRSSSSPSGRTLVSRLRGLFRLRWLVLAAIIAGVCAFAFDVDTVDTRAMAPGVEPGDVVLIDRLAAEFASPDPGDVVLIRNPDDRDRELMVRVVAIENDMVATAPRGQVWVNGDGVVRDDPSESWRASDDVDAMASVEDTLPAELGNGSEHRVLVRDDALTAAAEQGEVEVPAGHIFVVGDNRARAYDSRSFGPVPVADVVGRVRVVLRADDPDRGLIGRWVRLP